jgi:CTP synthase
VPVEAVIGLETLDTVYAVPQVLEEQGLGDYMTSNLGIECAPPDLASWIEMTEMIRAPKPPVKIAVVGKYVDLPDSYMSVHEALRHAGIHHGYDIEVQWIGSEDVERVGPEELLADVSGIVVPGGFGPRGIEGMIQTVAYARTRGIPYLGLCLGMQVMVVEYARSQLGLPEANSTEFDSETPDPVIAYLPGQQELLETGGTMRLGVYPCKLRDETVAASAYGVDLVHERHRHRYELNNEYRARLEEVGLVASGVAPDDSLVEITEALGHPFMLGSQFHPEFASRPDRPHPLFREFIRAAKDVIREGGQPPLRLGDTVLAQADQDNAQSGNGRG